VQLHQLYLLKLYCNWYQPTCKLLQLHLSKLPANRSIAWLLYEVVTYARQQRFFNNGVLIQAPGGHDALTMYAGALMWLTCFVFAIAACSWTVFGVNDYLQKLGDGLNGLRVQARKDRD
jgi:hypothetical protein